MTTTSIFVARNFHDEAVVSASEAAANFPVTNTQIDGRSRAWRSLGPGTVTLSGTFTRPRVVDYFAMLRHQNHGGKIRVQLFTDAAWSTVAIGGDPMGAGGADINKIVGNSTDSAFAWGDDPYGIGEYDPFLVESPYWYRFVAPVVMRSYKITLSAHSSTFWPGAFWHIGRLWLGLSYDANKIRFGPSNGWQDNTEATRTRGGTLRTNLGNRWRVLKFDWFMLSPAQQSTLLDMLAYCQRGRGVLMSLDDGDGTRMERDGIINGKLVALNAIGRPVRIFEHSMALEET